MKMYIDPRGQLVSDAHLTPQEVQKKSFAARLKVWVLIAVMITASHGARAIMRAGQQAEAQQQTHTQMK